MKKYDFYGYFVIFAVLFCVICLELRMLENFSETKKDSKEDVFDTCMEMVDQVFSELQCFPVVREGAEEVYPVTYENSWGSERTYGGERTHEGCDLMAASNERGRYQVCSMTDGTVKNIGWLEQGGWRIGIESDSGVYYYYAHLDSYEKAYEKGERIVAGQILGRMGDSGYGKQPGTKGKFAVHLHIGIYLTDPSGKERAINPYWYLKHLEK